MNLILKIFSSLKTSLASNFQEAFSKTRNVEIAVLNVMNTDVSYMNIFLQK